MLTQEGLAIQHVYTLPKWMSKGIGVNGGGDTIGSVLINGLRKKVYISWSGINTKRLMPGYFHADNAGFDEYGNLKTTSKWYRLSTTGGW